MALKSRGYSRTIGSIFKSLPETPPCRNRHHSFTDVFRSSRLASVQHLDDYVPPFKARHAQLYPLRQVISSFNAAQRRGDWGLKRPLPQVNNANINVHNIDSQDREAPFTFATEKARFVERMTELGLVLEVPALDITAAKPGTYHLEQRQARRQVSPLEHLHPQWTRPSGTETGPRVLTLPSKKYKRYLRNVSHGRPEFEAMLAKYNIRDFQITSTTAKEAAREKEMARAKQLVRAHLDLASSKPTYKTHPTAGLVYMTKGYMPSTTDGTKSNARTMVGKGRKIADWTALLDPPSALVLFHGTVASMNKKLDDVPDRDEPVDMRVTSATVSREGRLEIAVADVLRGTRSPTE
jgi:Mitochondrial ribosomal protein subunit